MDYAADKDEIVGEIERIYTLGGIVVPSEEEADGMLQTVVCRYNHGLEKVAIKRLYLTAKSGWKAAKLSRLSWSEAKHLLKKVELNGTSNRAAQ